STDMLTNVHNRRSLFELGNKQLQIARRYQRPLTLIIMDVDHFKNINDTYGHAVGDLVLKHIAKACKTLLRSADILGRYGGEEFVALFPETDIDGTAIIAERLRILVQNLKMPEINDLSNVTISLGVAMLSPSDTDISQTINRADKALYQAKQQGRNKVIFSQV
ncbi:MAG: GGDEF domain-containing protein, partial [Burkholderiaceae bacterium]